jgi:hypothetical protein
LKISCEADQYYCVGRDVLAKRRSKIRIFWLAKQRHPRSTHQLLQMLVARIQPGAALLKK